MKKVYMTPIVNVESAEPTNLLCESFNSNAGLDGGGGSDGEAHAPEWDVWGEDE